MNEAASSHHTDIESENKKFYTFVNLALFMAAITGIELIVIFIPFADWVITTSVVVLSLVKFIGVLAWFMHLVYDKSFYTILFLMGLIVALGTYTALMFLFSSKDVLLP